MFTNTTSATLLFVSILSDHSGYQDSDDIFASTHTALPAVHLSHKRNKFTKLFVLFKCDLFFFFSFFLVPFFLLFLDSSFLWFFFSNLLVFAQPTLNYDM